MDEHTFALDEIDLYVTMRCNLSCGFCSVCAGSKIPDLPLARIQAVIDEAADMGLKELHLTGGEPALRTDLEMIIAHATARGVQTRVITNGTLMTRERLMALKHAGLGSVMFSLDGLEKTHERMRGAAGCFGKTLQAVQDSIALGLKTRINAAVFRTNRNDILPLMRLAATHNVDVFSFFLGSPLGRGRQMIDQIMSPPEWRTFLNEIQNAGKNGEFGSTMAIAGEQGFIWTDTPDFKKNTMRGRGCGCTTLLDDWEYLIIRSDGELFQCVFFMQDGPSIGSIAHTGLKDALTLARTRRLYERFTRAADGCSHCRWLTDCQGGCRGYAFLYTGDWHQRAPQCADAPAERSFFPICPIAKLNIHTGKIDGSSEHVLAGY